MKTLYLLLLPFFFLHFYAQDTELELKELKNIDLLIDSASNNITKNPTLSIEIAKQAKKLLKNHNSKIRLGNCYRILGGAHYFLGEYDNAIKNYSTALDYSLAVFDTLNNVKNYRGIGMSYNEKQDYVKGEQFLNIASELANQADLKKEMIDVLVTKGVSFFYQKNYLKAVDAYKEGIDISKEMEDSSNLYYLYFNLGGVYLELDKTDLALNILLEGRQLAENSKETYVEANFHTLLAAVYVAQEKYTLAISYYETAIEMYQDCQYVRGIAYSKMSLAIIYEKQDNLNKSLIEIEESYDYAKSIDDGIILGFYHLLHAKIEFKKMAYVESLNHLDKALKFYEKSGDLVRKKEALELKASIYENLGNYKESLFYYKEFEVVKDSLDNAETASKIENIELKRVIENAELKHENRKQKLTLAKKEEQSTKEKLYLVSLSAFLFLTLLVGFFTYKSTKLKRAKELALKKETIEKLKNEVIALTLEKTEEEKKELEIEVNDKNNKIKSLVYSLNQKNDLLENLSDEPLFKEQPLLFKKMKRIIDTEEERAFFNEEINLMNVKFHKKLTLRFPNLSDNDLKISSMLKMGLSSKEMGTLLSISSSSVDVARSRLRKKMELSKDDNLIKFLNEV